MAEDISWQLTCFSSQENCKLTDTLASEHTQTVDITPLIQENISPLSEVDATSSDTYAVNCHRARVLMHMQILMVQP